MAPKPPHDRNTPILIGMAAITFAVVGLGLWGSIAPIASAVIVQGDVVVASKRKEIQHLYGGTVANIRARDGDTVQKGDILIELDARKADSRYSLAQSTYFAFLATRSRLLAERDAQKEIVFPN